MTGSLVSRATAAPTIRRDSRSWTKTTVRILPIFQSRSTRSEPAIVTGPGSRDENCPSDSNFRTTATWLSTRPLFSPRVTLVEMSSSMTAASSSNFGPVLAGTPTISTSTSMRRPSLNLLTSASAGGPLEQPSDVKSSSTTGAASLCSAERIRFAVFRAATGLKLNRVRRRID